MDPADIVLEAMLETRYWMNQLDDLQPDIEVGLAQEHMQAALAWLERIKNHRFPTLAVTSPEIQEEESIAQRSAA